MTIKVGIIGATGYVGIELVRLLQQHPAVNITHLVTESYVGQSIAQVYPHLNHFIELNGSQLDLAEIIKKCDLIFMALPHGKAANITEPLLLAGKKVIDLGADFRLRNPQDYETWYQHPPATHALLNKAVYGLPELGYRDRIQNASLIANPGCYPTATLLAARPALEAGVIDANDCIIDAKSGVSGAGRGLSLTTHYCEVAENLTPYKLAGQHRHIPEIEQEFSVIAKQPVVIQFTPHLVPMIRGMLITAYFKLSQSVTETDIHALYHSAYQQEPFVRVRALNDIPQVKHVRSSNYCDIGICVDTRTQRLIVVSVIDNLMKGAAGQAVQNMNLLYELPETLGLINCPSYP